MAHSQLFFIQRHYSPIYVYSCSNNSNSSLPQLPNDSWITFAIWGRLDLPTGRREPNSGQFSSSYLSLSFCRSRSIWVVSKSWGAGDRINQWEWVSRKMNSDFKSTARWLNFLCWLFPPPFPANLQRNFPWPAMANFSVRWPNFWGQFRSPQLRSLDNKHFDNSICNSTGKHFSLFSLPPK